MSNLAKSLGLLRTCSEECGESIETTIKGVIPLWLKGTLLRNGPGLQEIGSDKYHHAFDGSALVHRFHINNGSVEYQNKFLRSDSYNRNVKANRIVVTEFGTNGYPDPCKTLWQRFMSYFSPSPGMTDNTNVNIYPVNDEIYAATETNFIRRIDPNSLSTLEKVDLSKYLTINVATAHPHVDTDGSVYNMGSSFGRNGKYKLIKIPKQDNPFQNASIVCSIPMERPLNPCYYHSFSMTNNYFIFIEQPLVINVPTLALSHITGKSYAESLHWKPELRTRFYVIDRKDNKIIDTKYMSDSFAFFHTINAFEDNNHLVLDICCYLNGKVISALSANALEKESKLDAISEVRRFVLPLSDRLKDAKPDTNVVDLDYTKASASISAKDSSVQLIYESLTSSGVGMGELARINYKYNGNKYRFFYSLLQPQDSPQDSSTQLMKFDIKTKQSIIWSEENTIPSEPVFVETPNISSNDDNEDEGVILSSVLSTVDETKGFLLVLDAKTFKELGRAQFQTKSSITGSFHGLFVQ